MKHGDAPSPALSDAEVEAITAAYGRVFRMDAVQSNDVHMVWDAVPRLLAEVSQQRAEIERLQKKPKPQIPCVSCGTTMRLKWECANIACGDTLSYTAPTERAGVEALIAKLPRYEIGALQRDRREGLFLVESIRHGVWLPLETKVIRADELAVALSDTRPAKEPT